MSGTSFSVSAARSFFDTGCVTCRICGVTGVRYSTFQAYRFREKGILRAFLLTIPVIYFSMGDRQFYNRQSLYFILLAWTWFMMMRQTPFAFHSARVQTLS